MDLANSDPMREPLLTPMRAVNEFTEAFTASFWSWAIWKVGRGSQEGERSVCRRTARVLWSDSVSGVRGRCSRVGKTRERELRMGLLKGSPHDGEGVEAIEASAA